METLRSPGSSTRSAVETARGPSRDPAPGPSRDAEHRRTIVRDLAVGLVPVVAVPLFGAAWLGYDPSVTIAAVAVYAVVALLILRTVPPRLPGSGLGPANRVTLTRVAIALPVAGFAVFPAAPDPVARWWLVGLATLALALDGVDGWIARRTDTETAWGARFDMETDAALLLALSIVAWRVGTAGVWILGIGLLRYLFVAAGVVEPRLRGELPENQLRRKTVCVVQGVALPFAVAPLGFTTLQLAVAAAALGLLVWSFAVDTAWLLRHGPEGRSPIL